MSQYNDFYSGVDGGYVQGPFSAGDSPGGTRQKSEASHSLRPVTIAQLIKASQAHTDAEWTIDDTEVGQVTLLGQVISVQVQTTNCVYSVDDGTGRIEARHWIDSSREEDSGKWGGIHENAYVRVTGALKSFGNKRYVNATHIRASTDPHELYFHILESIIVTLTIERGPPPGPGQASSIKPAVTDGVSAYATQSHSGPVSDHFSHLNALQQSIVKFIIAQPPKDEGVHVAAIARAIGTEGDAHKISNALDQLMDEGLVFTTFDDSHFKVTT